MKRPAHPRTVASIRRLGGEAFWVAFGIGFSTLGTFVGVRLLTAMMAPGEYGKVALAVSVAMGLQYSLGAGMGGSITRFFPIAQQDGAARWYWRAVRRSAWMVAVLTALLGAGSLAAVFAVTGLWRTAVFWSLTIFLGGLLVLNILGASLQTGARNRKTVSLHQCLLDWGRFLAAFCWLAVWSGGALAVLAAFVVMGALTAASQWFWVDRLLLRNRPAQDAGIDRMDDFFRYLQPMVLAGLFFWIQMFSDRWALQLFCSIEQVGFYFAVYQISYSPMVYLSAFLFNFSGPVLFGRAGDGSDLEQHRQTLLINEKIAGLILLLVVGAFLVAWWVGPVACGLMIDSRYSEGFWSFPWLLASGGFYAVAQQLLLSVYSGLDTAVMVPVRAAAALLSCLFYMGGAYLAGFHGAVFGGLLFSVVFLGVAVGLHLASKKRG